MATLTINTIGEITIGGEKLRFSRYSSISVGDTKFDQKALVADDNTTATLWTAATSPIASFTTAIIIVDPDNVYADNAAAAKLEIEFQGDGTDVIAFTVRREAPLILTTNDIGSDVDNIDELIDTIRAKNTNAEPAEGNSDVAVRLILLS